jgi:hypothetical protein
MYRGTLVRQPALRQDVLLATSMAELFRLGESKGSGEEGMPMSNFELENL